MFVDYIGWKVFLYDLWGCKVIVFFYFVVMMLGCMKEVCDFCDSFVLL